MGAAIVPDVIVIRHHGDIRCLPMVVPDEPNDRIVTPMSRTREDAADPGQALIAATLESEVTVKNDDALHGRVSLAPPGYQKSKSVSRVFQPTVQAGLQFGEPVDDIITVNEEDWQRWHKRLTDIMPGRAEVSRIHKELFVSREVKYPATPPAASWHPRIRLQWSLADGVLAGHLGPKHTFTIECPYGTEDERVVRYALARYPASRNRLPEPFLEEFNRWNDRYPGISLKEYVQWQRGVLTATPMSLMKSWVDTIARHENIWLVLVFHGIDGIGWEPKTGAELKEYFGSRLNGLGRARQVHPLSSRAQHWPRDARQTQDLTGREGRILPKPRKPQDDHSPDQGVEG
ncbi:MAG: polysaccharide deacetylase family protein [Candidatus Aminicenantes bacterium]|nr:polysaccharide deacetylase family protein [Candidatus Aminicenantes bacterium]